MLISSIFSHKFWIRAPAEELTVCDESWLMLLQTKKGVDRELWTRSGGDGQKVIESSFTRLNRRWFINEAFLRLL